MKNHVIKVVNRKITVDDYRIIANGINTDTITLDLDSEWDGLQVYVLLGPKGTCFRSKWSNMPLTIPDKLLEKTGFIPVSIVGVSPLRRVTTRSADRALRVVASGLV